MWHGAAGEGRGNDRRGTRRNEGRVSWKNEEGEVRGNERRTFRGCEGK